MVELMKLKETNKVMELWTKEMFQLTNDEMKVNSLAFEVKEELGHGNVYVYHNEDGEITSFATVHEGYFISDLIVEGEMACKALIETLKARYGELQLDLPLESVANNFIESLGFIKLGESENQIFDYKEIQYEYLSEN